MTKMNRIYADAEDKYVLNTVLYGKSSKLYTDKETKNEVTYKDALNLCMKGAVVFDTDTYYTITSFKDDDSSLTVKTDSTHTYTVTEE